MADQQKVIQCPSNSAFFNYLQQPLTNITSLCHYFMRNILEMP